MELDHVGGTFGGNIKPTPFLCLVLKMLQIQPEKEIVVEFIKNEDYKWVMTENSTTLLYLLKVSVFILTLGKGNILVMLMYYCPSYMPRSHFNYHFLWVEFQSAWLVKKHTKLVWMRPEKVRNTPEYTNNSKPRAMNRDCTLLTKQYSSQNIGISTIDSWLIDLQNHSEQQHFL